MNEIHLTGCNPVPLAGYLKALGVFRLVSEQADSCLAGSWPGQHFCLQTTLTEEELIDFFMQSYRPTPILAPWNGGSGFFPKDNREGLEEVLERLLNAEAERFRDIKDSIRWASDLLRQLGIKERPDNKEKKSFLQKIRSTAPDTLLPWLDAAITLSADSIFFPPLLGTGGNDGRLDFTNNFMQRLAEIFDTQSGAPKPRAKQWIRNALFGEPTPALSNKPIGQFFPGSIGGANSTTGFSSDSMINPFDFVLMLEGSLLFASAITRKNDTSAKGRLSYPFTVKMSGGGSGSIAMGDEKKTRGEIWLPLWKNPAGPEDIKQLFKEGRATVGKRPARDGLDFSLAVAQLGIDRGIQAFERYSFLERNGLAYIASPIGRRPVRYNQNANLVTNLNKNTFLDKLRKTSRGKEIPNSLAQAAGRLENSLFDLTRPGSGRQAIQRTVIRIGEVMRILAASRKSRLSVAVMPDLSVEWSELAYDDSPEFRIAAALCSLKPLSVIQYLYPVKSEKGRLVWDPESRSAIWGAGSILERNLSAMAWRRIIDAEKEELKEKPFDGHLGATLSDIEAFLNRQTNDTKIEALLHGLAWARLPGKLTIDSPFPKQGVLPASYKYIKPFFTKDTSLKQLRIIAEDRPLHFPKEMISLLKAGNIDRATAIAWQRLKIAGAKIPLNPAGPPSGSAIYDGPRLLASLLIPLSFRATATLTPEKPTTQHITATV